jgi:hypothetical protein
MMHLPINVKSNNISKWLMGFNSAFKGLNTLASNVIGMQGWVTV